MSQNEEVLSRKLKSRFAFSRIGIRTVHALPPLVLIALGVGEAAAGPDSCTIVGIDAHCAGDQSLGVVAGQDFDQTNLANIFLESTPPVSGGSSGLRWDITGNNISQFNSLHATFPTPGVVAATGPAIRITSGGGPGGMGRGVSATTEVDLTSNGGTDGAIFVQSTGPNGASRGWDGGSGTSGGSTRGAEAATITSDRPGSVRANGDGNSAINVISQGGSGGSGGDADGIFDGAGGGAGGARGGDATVKPAPGWTFQSSYAAKGSSQANAPAISITSTGGNGGNGGSCGACAGAGGGGGGAGGFAVFNMPHAVADGPAYISTLGVGGNSPGLQIVSQGGAGGAGGDGETFSSGGKGGVGGAGGQASVYSNLEGSTALTPANLVITTRGPTSDGIMVASVGGIGGDGGNGSVFGTSGGSGGDSGSTQSVSVLVTGTIETMGAESYGIFAQGLAGHGGSSGWGRYNFATEGGSAGNGGTVSVNSSSEIKTHGDGSVGISVLSTGGGGGHGGSSFGLFFAESGTAGNGGAGGDAIIANAGSVSTQGDDANALYAQSIGGVGGDGGSAGAIVALGGRAGNSSNGGRVLVINTGALSTGANNAEAAPDPDPTCGIGCSGGIVAQSIGGGGGVTGTADGGNAGGMVSSVGGAAGAGGRGGEVTVDNAAPITTRLATSDVILAQSIGGGGGKAGGAAGFEALVPSVVIGGTGGNGGSAGNVSVNAFGPGALTAMGDESRGIVAQSIGGGGGVGGFATALTVSAAPDASVTVGGTGGSGGAGGAVTVITGDQTGNPTISTAGANAPGILAQSIGGGGGAGGWTVAASGGVGDGLPTAAIAVSVGGSGGNAAGGGSVDVTNRAAISTRGDSSTGIFAQSISQGGGAARFSAAGTADLPNGSTGVNVSVSLGGDGGAGATAGTVNVENSAAITTLGAFAHGVDAQSVGGDGGSGGIAVSGTLQGDGSVGVALGGTGGAAGAANQVYLVNDGPISVTGDKSMGLSAQSIGGDGGRGAVAITGQLNVTDGKQLGVSLGGAGGSGGAGSVITLLNTGAISTGSAELPDNPEDNAHAIFAQSVGGDGGHGGIAGAFTFGSNQTDKGAQLNAEVAIGGKGAAGATGDEVKVINSGALTTWAGQSHGIFAQSVGGSGGAGGSGYSGSFQALSNPKSSTYNMSFAMGGTGGSGGDAGVVAVDNSAPIQVNGQAHSTGILAQSIGGGGGSGGSAHTLLWNLIYETPFKAPADPEEGMNIGLQVRVGGAGGASGAGDNVFVTNRGSIHTLGSDSIGIHAYSIGGGGGDGGQASGLYVFPIPGTDRTPILKSVSISVGGDAGAGGDGGDIAVAHSAGDILTEGAGSPGVYAQSVGGGGGMGGTGAAGLTGTVAVGGRGGATGDGGKVTVDFTGGSITTLGGNVDSTDPNEAIDSGFGIFAQSVGGGGGHAGNATFFGIPTSLDGDTLGGVTFGIGLGIDLEGGAAGDGGAVKVTADGAISTAGPNATGIFAQSVGGGGGLSGNIGLGGAGTLTLATLLGSSGGNGAASEVDVEVGGALTTTGDGAQGVFAQSAAPNGSGKVSVTVYGSVRAFGTDANGILAQSQKGATFDSHGQPTSTTGGAPVEIWLQPGAVVQGGVAGTRSNGAGIQILDGTSNEITLKAGSLLTSVAGHAGWAIQSGNGSENVTNFGAMIGSVDLGGGSNGFNNLTLASGSRWEPGATAALGSTLVVQSGIVSPFGDDAIGVTSVNAPSFGQSPSAVTVITLDAAKGTADQLRFAQSVGLSGQLDVDTIDIGQGGESGSVTVMTYPGLAASGAPIAVRPSAVGNFSLDSNPGALLLDYNIDFASDALLGALGRNGRAVASYLKRLHDDGELPREFAYLLEAADAESYAHELNALSPISYAAVPQIVAGAADRLAGRLMSCREREGAYRFVAQNSCLRMDVFGQWTDRDATNGDPGYSVRTAGLAFGGQAEVVEDTQIGFNLAWEPWSADGDGDIWRASSDQFVGGVALKRQVGDTAFAVTLGGGFGDVEHRRQGPRGATAKANQSVSFVGGTARASRAFVFGDRYVEPRLVLAATHVSAAGVDEKGGDVGRLSVKSVDQIDVTVSPQVAFGGDVALPDGALLRPRFVLGLTQYLTDPNTDVTANFAGVGGAGGGFDYVGDAGRTRFDVEAGFDLFARNGLQVRAQVAGQFSANTTSTAASLRASWAF